jgi:ribosomal protein S18 acetylase RimI-like enzyme
MDWLVPKDYLSQVEIRPFKREDQAPVKQLILNCLAEHWGWLDPQRNPDLGDIGASYSEGIFLVAENQGEIVGTGGLLPGAGGSMEIVRVHVAEHYRRMGIGSLIVAALCENAQIHGAETVVLETTETWEDAIAFYVKLDFQIMHRQNGDVYMAKQLDTVPPGLKTTSMKRQSVHIPPG